MSDHGDVFKAFEDDAHASHHAEVRIHLLTGGRPAVNLLRDALPEYRVVVPRSNDDLAFIRPMTIGSEEQFRQECGRVAGSIAHLVTGGAYLGCLYDEAGSTRYNIELRKASADEGFIETGSGANAG